MHLLVARQALHERFPEPLEELAEVDVVVIALHQDLVDGGDRQDPVDRVVERPQGIDTDRPRLQPQERCDRLKVVLDAVVDLLGQHAAHHRPPVLECDRRMVGDRREQRSLVVGEGAVLVGDELADLAALPAEGRPHGERPGAALRPRDLAVLEHERGAGRGDGRHRRLDDRLERLLQVERFRDGLRDPGERLELLDAALRGRVELRVLDRLGNLRGDRKQELDLAVAEDPWAAGADVQRPLERLAREDRHREDRLVLVLGQIDERLEARVEVRVGGDHDRLPRLRGRAGDPLPGLHLRPPRHLLDARAVRRTEDELVGALVVEVDEARIRLERLRHLPGHESEHLLEVERRVHGRRRLGQKPQVPGRLLHRSIVGGTLRRFAGGNRGAAGILEHMSRILREIARAAMAAQERWRLTYLATAPAAPVPGAAAFQRA